VQQYDYFCGRALQLDGENMRKQQEEDRLKNLGHHPCRAMHFQVARSDLDIQFVEHIK
jgi:hypothetical protein